MDESEFLEKMRECDRQLRESNVPPHARVSHAFKILAPDYVGPVMGYRVKPEDFPEYVGPNLFLKISDWYDQYHGEKMLMPSDRGRVPILIRGEVYLARIPLVFGEPSVKILPLIEELTPAMVEALEPSELQEIEKVFVEGCALVYEVEDLRAKIEHGGLSWSPPSVTMLERAVADREMAASALSAYPRDENGCCFHSQQYAEKMLKVFLVEKGGKSLDELKKKFGHKLSALFGECTKIAPDFSGLLMEMSCLNNVEMGIRYGGGAVGKENAVETFRAALRIAGLCACELSGCPRRKKVDSEKPIEKHKRKWKDRLPLHKTKSFISSVQIPPGKTAENFNPRGGWEVGKFYHLPELDFNYYCESVQSGVATIWLVEPYQRRFEQRVEWGKHYAEIIDPDEIARLRTMYDKLKDAER